MAELEKGLRSGKESHQLEALFRLGPRLRRWALSLPSTHDLPPSSNSTPDISEDVAHANALVLRLVDAFAQGPNALRMAILQIFLLQPNPLSNDRLAHLFRDSGDSGNARQRPRCRKRARADEGKGEGSWPSSGIGKEAITERDLTWGEKRKKKDGQKMTAAFSFPPGDSQRKKTIDPVADLSSNRRALTSPAMQKPPSLDRWKPPHKSEKETLLRSGTSSTLMNSTSVSSLPSSLYRPMESPFIAVLEHEKEQVGLLHASRLLNPALVLKRIKKVLTGVDSLGRVLALRLLACAANLVANAVEIHHIVLVSWDSAAQDERIAARLTACALVELSDSFSDVVLHKLRQSLLKNVEGKMGFSNSVLKSCEGEEVGEWSASGSLSEIEMEIRLLQHLGRTPSVAMEAHAVGEAVIRKLPSSAVTILVLETLTRLALRSPDIVERQGKLLLFLLRSEPGKDVRLAALIGLQAIAQVGCIWALPLTVSDLDVLAAVLRNEAPTSVLFDRAASVLLLLAQRSPIMAGHVAQLPSLLPSLESAMAASHSSALLPAVALLLEVATMHILSENKSHRNVRASVPITPSDEALNPNPGSATLDPKLVSDNALNPEFSNVQPEEALPHSVLEGIDGRSLAFEAVTWLCEAFVEATTPTSPDQETVRKGSILSGAQQTIQRSNTSDALPHGASQFSGETKIKEVSFQEPIAVHSGTLVGPQEEVKGGDEKGGGKNVIQDNVPGGEVEWAGEEYEAMRCWGEQDMSRGIALLEMALTLNSGAVAGASDVLLHQLQIIARQLEMPFRGPCIRDTREVRQAPTSSNNEGRLEQTQSEMHKKPTVPDNFASLVEWGGVICLLAKALAACLLRSFQEKVWQVKGLPEGDYLREVDRIDGVIQVLTSCAAIRIPVMCLPLLIQLKARTRRRMKI
eukprot:TRINITY_DN22166_c0_g1_i1.p1 TRINITY_DN22166_c0_g1~~TRINITY_DN22166_c0_g1_i1.p1  ORF type:complete len:961 (+),score=148.27 TRINITY_DN22166_c0_g1_i1:134-2884(+)